MGMWRLLSSQTPLNVAIAVFSMAIFSSCVGPTDTAGKKSAPELVVTVAPANVKITDDSKQGTRLATVAVRRSDGLPFNGELALTNNPGKICQLVGMNPVPTAMLNGATAGSARSPGLAL